MKDWIKMSERKPADNEFPIWAYGAHWTHWWRNRYDMQKCEPLWQCYDHWRSAAGDAPVPPKEEAQQEKDHAAYLKLVVAANGPLGGMTAWHAALRYERAEVLKMLDKDNNGFAFDATATFKALRTRCTP